MISYHRNDDTHLEADIYRFDSDTFFTFIKVVAARHFEHYLHHRDIRGLTPFATLEWGDFPKTALVEFIYACFEASVFKNTTLRNITKVLSFAFGLMLSEQEVNQKWQEIKARKKEKIIFLHTLQEALLRRLERQDQ